MKFSFNEQLDMLLVYGEVQKNSVRTQALYAEKYPNHMHYIVSAVKNEEKPKKLNYTNV